MELDLECAPHSMYFILKKRRIFCSLCCSDFSVSHAWKGDVVKHVNTKKHADNIQSVESNKLDVFSSANRTEDRVTNAERLFTYFIIENNLAISCADQAGSLLRKRIPIVKLARMSL
ncbi:hypothetical protein PR048_024174 [Dryococelus australis]|uniref:Uncharacterized protein n=1 Tax=Dryococelus australis TaxID=614101 RepID=A0ABQ9GWA3_9NEOP|nr:hypothetical protein PR048_024174 [Dryococelus australis]